MAGAARSGVAVGDEDLAVGLVNCSIESCVGCLRRRRCIFDEVQQVALWGLDGVESKGAHTQIGIEKTGNFGAKLTVSNWYELMLYICIC